MSPEELFGFDKTNLKVWSISLLLTLMLPHMNLELSIFSVSLNFSLPRKMNSDHDGGGCILLFLKSWN